MDGSTSTIMKKKKNPPQNVGMVAEDGEIIYNPTHYDVLLGRGRPFQSWPGNKRLHTVVDMYKPRYTNAKRHEKTEISEEIVLFIKSTGKEKVGRCGRFLRRVTLEEVRKQRAAAAASAGGDAPTAATANIEGYDDHIAFLTDTSVVTSVGGGGWVEVSDLVARDKVSHALRGKSPETATVSTVGTRDQLRIAQSVPGDEKIIPAEGTLKSTTSRSTKTKASVVKKKSGSKIGLKAPSMTSSSKAKTRKGQGKMSKTVPVARKAVKPSSKVSSDTTYRSHTEAIVQDLLRRKQGSGITQQSNEKRNDDSKTKTQELSQGGSLAVPPSGTSDRSQMVTSFGQQLGAFQQQRQQQAMGGMNLPLQQFPQVNAQSFGSSIPAEYLQELRARNAMLERELALARLRGTAGFPTGLGPTSLAMNNGLPMGANWSGNVQTVTFSMLPQTASAAAASATFGANSNNSAAVAAALRGIGGNSTASPGNVASMLPGSQLPIIPTATSTPNNNSSQLMASNQFLSGLRNDELLSLLARSNNSSNNNNS